MYRLLLEGARSESFNQFGRALKSEVHHAQRRFDLRRVSCTDRGRSRASVLKLAGLRVHLIRRDARRQTVRLLSRALLTIPALPV